MHVISNSEQSRIESSFSSRRSHNDMEECPHTLHHFIANAPLEGDFFSQIRADIAQCYRLECSIPATIVDRISFIKLAGQGQAWRCAIAAFQQWLEAFAPAEKLLDHASGLDLSDYLEGVFHDMEKQIEEFCENLRKYKYRISRIIRLPLYVECLARSQRRPIHEKMYVDVIRESHSPDIDPVGALPRAIDKDTLLEHITDLRRVDSVVKEWTFMAKIVKSAIAIKYVGWNVDYLKLCEEIDRWETERGLSEEKNFMRTLIEKSEKEIVEWQKKLYQTSDEKLKLIHQEKAMQEALEEATKQKEEYEGKFHQKVNQNLELSKEARVLHRAVKESYLILTVVIGGLLFKICFTIMQAAFERHLGKTEWFEFFISALSCYACIIGCLGALDSMNNNPIRYTF